MRRLILTALIAFVVGIGVGAGGYALIFAKDDPGVYCYDVHPDDVFDDTQRCVPSH